MSRLPRSVRVLAAFVLALTALVGVGHRPATAADGSMIITGVVDGPLSGGVPKAIEVYVQSDISDLTAFGLGAANNGGGTDGEEFTFPSGTASAGTFLYVASESTGFTDFFGFAPDHTSFAASINGDDAIELFEDGAVVDVFGAIDVDGTGQAWEYTDGWAKRNDLAGAPTTAFDPAAWTFSGPDALDGETTNAGAATPFPIGDPANDDDGDDGDDRDGAPPTGLVINEIDYDQASTDAAEFVEITNTGDTPADLSGVEIELVNGNGNSVYDTIGLPATSLAAGDHFVVCANAGTVATCDLDDGPDTNFIQNGSPDAIGLRAGDGTLLDAVSYEGDVAGYVEGTGSGLEDDPGVEASGLSRCPDGADTDQNATDFVAAPITPGAANDCGDGSGGDGDDEPIDALIHEVQGAGPDVAIADRVRVEAIVVGDYQEADQLDGFFIQEEDADADADQTTSEGLFVFCGGCATDVTVGDLVSVEGLAEDFFGMSQIDTTADGSVSVVSSGNALPTPAMIELPDADGTDEAGYEEYEGMLVVFDDILAVSEYFQLARFGQLVLTADARPAQFTDANEPSVTGYAEFLDDLARSRIILDDDNNTQNAAIAGSTDEPYYWPRPGLSTSNLVRGGDRIDGLTGVLHWSWAGSFGTDAWRVRPVEEAFTYEFVTDEPRATAPEDVGGTLQVASFNVLNYFTTLDARGADSVAELDRQRVKIAEAICAIDADVVGLIEIENNGSAAISDLLEGEGGVNATCGGYDFVDTGTIGSDEIAVAFIYRTTTASPIGDFAILDSSVDPRFIDSKNRPALAQTFEETASGAQVTVVVNHLKSKGSPCDDVGDPDAGDGQGNCNGTRAAAAEAMVDWLAADPTGAGTDRNLIIGDLNSYRNEDPIDAIEAGADDNADTPDDYTDLLDTMIGADAYTYVFDGQLGYLDHALANQSLLGAVTGVTAWHINADEVPVLDYNDAIDDGSAEAFFERESSALPIYEPNAFRSSDHDPVIVGLDLNEPPVCSAAEPSRARIFWSDHRYRSIEVLGVVDPEGGEVDVVIDSIFQDEPVDWIGDGHTAPDGAGVGTSTARVRAERSALGDGRAYHIAFTATDRVGASCSGEVVVTVPVWRFGRLLENDGGANHDSTVVPPGFRGRPPWAR